MSTNSPPESKRNSCFWKEICFLGFFLWEFGPGQLTCFHFIRMKLDFISQPSSKSTLPFAGLQHMQQCQVNFNSIFPEISSLYSYPLCFVYPAKVYFIFFWPTHTITQTIWKWNSACHANILSILIKNLN